MTKTKKHSSRHIKSRTKKKRQQIIIHINGVPGSGKTTLGNKLIDNFGSKIIVKDLDDIFKEYLIHYKIKIDNLDINKYETYLSDFIKQQNSNKILILVGLNINLLNYRKGISNDFYNINPKPTYKFYISLPIKTTLNVRFERFWLFFCNNLQKTKSKIFKDLLTNQTTAINEINNSVKIGLNFDKIMKDTNIWDNYFRNADYKFYNRDKIFNVVSKIINKNEPFNNL